LRAYRRPSQTALTNWTVVLMGLLVLQGVTAVTSVLVARRVAPVEYGQYLSSLSLASLLIILPNFGMDTLLLARGGLPPERVAQLWRRLLRLRAALLAGWLVVMALLSQVLPAATYPFWVLWPTSLALAFESLVLLSHSALRSLGRHGWVTLLQSAVTVALLGITVGLQLQPGQIALFGLSRAAIWALVTPLSLWATGRLLRLPAPVVTVSSEAPVAPSALAFLLSDFAAAIYTRAPLSVVALFLGAEDVAAFGPAANLIFFTFVIPNALYFVVLPLLARMHRHRSAAFRRVGLAQLALQGLAGAGLSLGVAFFSGVIITRVLGANYAGALVSLVMLSPLPFLKSLNFGVAAVLSANERQNYRAVTQTICAIFNVIGSILVVHQIGLVGVALVFILSEALLLLGYALGAIWPRPTASGVTVLRPAGG
jgi:O-antigen/teichoic acid export membrane protein